MSYSYLYGRLDLFSTDEKPSHLQGMSLQTFPSNIFPLKQVGLVPCDMADALASTPTQHTHALHVERKEKEGRTDVKPIEHTG